MSRASRIAALAITSAVLATACGGSNHDVAPSDSGVGADTEHADSPGTDAAPGNPPPAPTIRKVFATGGIVRDLAVCADGAFVAAGWFASTIDFGGGPLAPDPARKSNDFVVGFDPAGNYRFAFRLATGGGDGALTRVECAPNGDIVLAAQVTGATTLDEGPLDPSVTSFNQVLVARVDPTGKRLFAKRFGKNYTGQTNIRPRALAIDSKGAAIVAASYAFGSGPVDFGNGPIGDRALFKLDASGTLAFARATERDVLGLSTIGEDIVELHQSVNKGGLLLRDDAVGAARWQRPYTFISGVLNAPLDTLAVTSRGEIYMMGHTYDATTIDIGLGGQRTESRSVVVAKVDGDGRPQWVQFGGPKESHFTAGAVDSRGDAIGLIDPPADYETLRVRADGKFASGWTFARGSGPTISLKTIALGPGDEVFVGGAEGASSSDSKLLILKLPPMP